MKSAGTGYDETFHQTRNDSHAGYNNLGGHYDGPEYDEADYYQAREGGTVADLSEYLAQKREEDADAGHGDNKSFEQDAEV